MGVPIMSETIGAYRQVTASSEFREIERLRSRARHDEAQALSHRDSYWKGIVADKDAENEQLSEEIKTLSEKIKVLSEKIAQLEKNK